MNKKSVKKSIYGEYKGDFLVPNSRIYIGVDEEGKEFAQMSFLSMGQMHSNFDEIKSINDKDAQFALINSGIKTNVKCKLHDDKLKIHFKLTDNLAIDYELEKVSNEAKYESEYYCIPEENINLLKCNNEYQKDELNVEYEYELENEDVLNELALRGIKKIKDKSFNSIWNLYKKICKLYTQNGVNFVHSKKPGTIAQMKQAELHNGFTNCRGISIIFSGVLRANGIKAFYEGLYPLNENDRECHIVCEVFVEELNKFVMFDPSLCTVYKLNGKYLNSLEIKNSIIDGSFIDIEFEYANNKKDNGDKIETLAYYSKNLGYLERPIKCVEKPDKTKNNYLILASLNLKDKKKDEIITTDIDKYFI